MQKQQKAPIKTPPKLVRLCANIINSHLANIINSDLVKDLFSEDAKKSICQTYFQNERTQ